MLLLSILTRHPSLLFAGLLPAYSLVSLAFSTHRRRTLWCLAGHSAAGLLVVFVAGRATAQVCRVVRCRFPFDLGPRSELSNRAD